MSSSNPEPPSLEDLIYTLNHVFLPPKLPQEHDSKDIRDVALCQLACNASRAFAPFLLGSQLQQWSIVIQMLDTLLKNTQVLDKDVLVYDIGSLNNREVLVLHIHAQNAAIILRRRQNTMVFEAFEVSPPPEAVMEVEGKLVCSYPGPAVELPLEIAQDLAFVEQLASFLVNMDVDQLDATATSTKAGSEVPETRGTTHPRYITQFFAMILYGMGKEANIDRITKRIADDVCWDHARNPWRRSSLWLVLRVAIQTTADSRETYKAFMVFFQAQLLQLFLDHNLPSELLHIARVKVSRRIHKLGVSTSPALRVLQVVETVIRATKHCLQGRWSEEQRLQATSPSCFPDPSSFEEDTAISLLNSRAYLTEVMFPDPYTRTVNKFHLSPIPRLGDSGDFHCLNPDGLTKAVQAQPYLALYDFELLVQEQLDAWVLSNKQDELACKTLGSCLEQYISAAQVQYSSNPEAESIMLLTIMELWVALDTIAVNCCPLLSSYSPEIPASFLDPILLRQVKYIERANRIQLYLRARHNMVTITSSIYSDKLDHTTFGVRYFNGSPSLQNLKAAIEEDASNIRERKREELLRLNESHRSLMQEISLYSCDRLGHSKKSCHKCSLTKRSTKLNIGVHEWPLPTRHLEAEAIIFELKCPPVFMIWRSQTYQILRDIGMKHVSNQSFFAPYILVNEYEGFVKGRPNGSSVKSSRKKKACPLSRSTFCPLSRITFGSATKSFLQSHYRTVKIPAQETAVCVNNGLRFRLYDSMKGEGIPSPFKLDIDPYCTLRLPEDGEGLYRHLQGTVAHTTHSHNDTVVNQGDCPINLSMHEHLSFSNLRCGSQLQWMNIARELRANILTFSREEVHTLLTQAAWQLGPLSQDGSIREWHFELGVSNFGTVLIQEAADLLSRVQGNWMEGTTVKTIIYLGGRILAATTNSQQEVRESGYALLRKAREISHKWMREIVNRLEDATDDHESSLLQRRVCEMAAICRATFDVDPGAHLDALLHSSEDVAILVECAIMVHDHAPSHNFVQSDMDLQRLLHRDRRLSHCLESPFNRLILVDQRGFVTAITSVWPEYRPGNTWKRDETNPSWLTSSTAPSSNLRAQQVHYNVLDGTLLVDGKPLGVLPRDIVNHTTYRRIFGQKILDVTPADMPGMEYGTRSSLNGNQVFFALRGRNNPQNLIIRARTPSGRVYELIPHNVFMEDFPTFLATEHVHWMDIHSGEIEFRSLDQPWKQSSENWFLQFFSSRMIQGTLGSRYLVDIRSRTFEWIAARIRPLENSQYLTTVYDIQSHTIWIDLPRFRLSFFYSNGELESKNMPSMIIDDNQSTGTMIGLSNQLVLRHKDFIFAELPRSRFVLIPHGDIQFRLSQNRNHVRVDIDTHSNFARHVTCYKYEIDTDLGLLVGNINLTSRLYRIYLHALCSHPLPDPLTSQTGTDHAVQELSAASCFSFQWLTETDVKLLRLIGGITPHRNYYPEHLRSMQTTQWSLRLPALSQHSAFDISVRSILRHAQSLAIFTKSKDSDLDYHSNGDSFLMTRARRRNALYYEGGRSISPDSDKKYCSRDSPHVAEHDSDGIEVLNVSRLVNIWPAGLIQPLGPSELLDTFIRWGHLNSSQVGSNTSLVYSKEWLSVDLPKSWLGLYDLCRAIQGNISRRFELIFSFAALAYSNPDSRQSIPILLALATISRSRFIPPPPPHPSYDLTDGFEPFREKVRNMVVSEMYSLDKSPAGQLQQAPNENLKKCRSRRSKYYNDISQQKINDSVNNLMNQWPCFAPRFPLNFDNSEWFDHERIMARVTRYFASCSRNADLLLFVNGLSEMLRDNYVDSSLSSIRVMHRFSFVPQFNVIYVRRGPSSTLEDTLASGINSAPTRSAGDFGMGAHTHCPRQVGQLVDTSDVKELISQFHRNNRSVLAKLYAERLERSLEELQGKETSILPHNFPPLRDCLAYRDQCRSSLDDFFMSISRALAPSTVSEQIIADAGLWPRIHPRAILQLMASTSNIYLPREWADTLANFAEVFIEYQHSQRLLAYALNSETDNFFKELDNASFNRSDARKNPDWLLIQIQGNFITRAVQSDVAREMMTPSSGRNTILQLNMGEGKSHVIVPLVATALADSKKLVRVVVLKPLAGQMFNLLVERISGLTNRRIFYLPFSRDVKIDKNHIQTIRSLFEECARVQGVLVAQPEHILSFRLMVTNRILSSGSPLDDVAKELYEIQKWLTCTSRDILDESDELLHVRYQLIYTLGEQQPLDDSPARWTMTQNILDLVRRHMRQLREDFLDEVELLNHHSGIEASEGTFSHIRLLGSAIANALLSRIAEDILGGALDNLIFVGLATKPLLRGAVLHFITEHNLDNDVYLTVESFYGKSGLWKGLLLLRGLLAHGILIYSLSQRWRVDYGLDSKRTLLAVPYRAKDMPSLRSEFGHSDVAICLTCLSYYYGGLAPSQVRECFELLIKLDNPPLEYERWVKRGGRDIPVLLRQLIGVNTKDVHVFTGYVVPIFQHNQAVIDFFLSQVVFPKEAKEFPSKLGMSGWDLAEQKHHVTTGFSGTKDNSDLLPISISQSDPVNQLQTNAQVLGYLLRPENNRYICTQDKNGQPCPATMFLEQLVREPEEVRVLLDVGAQMLEMTNQQLVKHWLLLRQDIMAGIFFDDSDTLSVLSQDGVVEPLYSSPFSQLIHQCVVYLDDAHTRGTDLRLPRKFRAVVTLGPRVTKDRLVQGCMRMRKLGHGQSVVFYAPPEVDKRIRAAENISASNPIKVIDVLSWAMSRTCFDIEHHIPHWVQQGVDYNRKRNADSALSSVAGVNLLKSSVLQPAVRPLDEMYGVLAKGTSNSVNDIPSMAKRLRMLGVTTVRNAEMEEEQEREVSHEVEQELQLERPPKVVAAAHHLDKEVRNFIQFGIMNITNSAIFFPLMTPLRSESEVLKPQNPWSRQLLCTRDFMTTTSCGKETFVVTEYLRPVNWIVSHITKDEETILVAMSPYEVNALLQDIRTSKYVRLHMYAPRSTQAMKPFDDLTFYCIPPLSLVNLNAAPHSPSLDVRCQLNIWAGQLYLDRYETYIRLCLLLGISSSETREYTSMNADRFIPENGRVGEMVDACLFNESPLVLLKTLFGLRRKGMSYEPTHMGKILNARLLSRGDFEEGVR